MVIKNNINGSRFVVSSAGTDRTAAARKEEGRAGGRRGGPACRTKREMQRQQRCKSGKEVVGVKRIALVRRE